MKDAFKAGWPSDGFPAQTREPMARGARVTTLASRFETHGIAALAAMRVDGGKRD
jgi:hypothetical protein